MSENNGINWANGFLKDIKFLRPFDLNKSFSDIEAYIKQCEDMRNLAINQVKEWNKDEEIQKLQAEIDKLKTELKEKKKGYTEFVITPEENNEINKWIDKHINEKHGGSHYAGAIGGRFTYKFIPTSIGEIGEIVCSCGESFCFREL